MSYSASGLRRYFRNRRRRFSASSCSARRRASRAVRNYRRRYRK